MSSAPPKRTLVISTDPAHSLGDALDQDISGGEPVRVMGLDNLSAMEVRFLCPFEGAFSTGTAWYDPIHPVAFALAGGGCDRRAIASVRRFLATFFFRFVFRNFPHPVVFVVYCIILYAFNPLMRSPRRRRLHLAFGTQPRRDCRIAGFLRPARARSHRYTPGGHVASR